VPENDTEPQGPPQPEGCLWCVTGPTILAGHFCSDQCWVAYYTWWQALAAEQNRGLVVLQPDEEVPASVRDQPWYQAAVERDLGKEEL